VTSVAKVHSSGRVRTTEILKVHSPGRVCATDFRELDSAFEMPAVTDVGSNL
jgi:hypothetical protein